MKKLLCALLVLTMLPFVGCASTPAETTEPKITEPETSAPEATTPEETTAPEVTVPEETTAPETTEPETTEPETTEPETTAAPVYNAPVVLSPQKQAALKQYLPTSWPATINQIMADVPTDFMFAVQTDTHYTTLSNDTKTGNNLMALSHFLPLSFYMHLGDYIKGYYSGEKGELENTPENTMTSLLELTDRYLADPNCPVLITYGNHDANQLWCKYYGTADQQLSAAEVYEHVTSKMVEHNGEDMVTNGESNYYYVDFPYDGVRVIMLNTTDGKYENTFDDLQYISYDQLQWFKNVALDTEYSVIVGAHVPLVNNFPNMSGSVPSAAYEIRAAINEFEQNGGDFIAYLYGHTHKQSDMLDEYGNLHISFREGGHHAEVVMINFENRHITTVGLNGAQGREFDY